MNEIPRGHRQPEQNDRIIWNYDFSISTFYGCELQSLLPLLPDGKLTLAEAIPGIGLINLTAVNFRAGGLDGLLPEFQELILSVGVTPDLSRTVPSFAMYVVSLASTCELHLEHSREYYKLPAHTLLTEVSVDREKLQIALANERGSIALLKSCADYKEYSTEPQERLIQAFTGNQPIYSSDCIFRARVQENQLAGGDGDVGTLHHHPFFSNLAVNDLELIPFVQMISDPDVIAEQYYYRSLPWK